MRILLIDDSIIPSLSLRSQLEYFGYDADELKFVHSAENVLKIMPYNAVIVICDVPDEKLLSVVRHWRKVCISIPVLIITSPVTMDVRVDLLNSGADDCMQQPAAAKEVAARLRAITRRSHTVSAPVLEYSDVTLDTGSRIVERGGKSVPLTSRETTILEIFLLQKDRVLSRSFLEMHLCTWRRDISSNTVEVHICNLRRKLGRNFIQTLHGQGYRLGPVSVDSVLDQ
ncbi:winged helix-turn-helix domain-containing protein [Citrobacter braakii]|uniref:winged helix-turn-helix domain-containing protein n=1 Tax=Citrobacter braakii TaxID=57706 RepID=UPI00351D2147